MANEVKKAVEEKEESSGLGALIGFTAAAAIPFLRPFRNLSKTKSALDTINSTNAARTTATETLVPKMLPAPKGIAGVPTKIKYDIVQRQPQIEPLINDRADAFKAVRGVPLDERPPQLLFGSSLYDQVKLFPKDKAKADDWLNMFKQKQNVKYSDGRSASVDVEELFDSNIAAFDKSGNLTGGLLKAAKDLNIEVDKGLLLKQVQLNPFNQLVLSKYKMPKGIEENQSNLMDALNKARDHISNKYMTSDNSTIRNVAKIMSEELDVSVKSLNQLDVRGGGEMLARNSIRSDVNRIRAAIRDVMKVTSDPQDKQILNDTLRIVNGSTEKMLTALSGKVKIPINAGDGQYGTYRLPGEANPGELVWHFPRTINRNLSNSNDRYHWEDARQPIVHAMYGTRYTPKGEKVIAINEVQSDVNSAVIKDLAEGKVRMNPFGKETERELLSGGLQPLRDKVNSILKKGIYATDDELYQMNKAMETLRGSRLLIKGEEALSKGATTDYMPFLNLKNYNDLALKTVIKEAADDGAQWVSVVPATAMSRGNGIVPGNELAYGYANGAGVGGKGQAILPELMKKLANQYKTEAKTIQVALSDPNKPYKIIKEVEVSKYSSKGGEKIGKETLNHHIKAFKTEDEAFRFLKSNERPSGALIEYIAKDDPMLYMNMYALRITPDMLNKPMKLYKHEGGLINNVFKPL
jgi:hypothetical protein